MAVKRVEDILEDHSPRVHKKILRVEWIVIASAVAILILAILKG